jgi:hypothetical protein
MVTAQVAGEGGTRRTGDVRRRGRRETDGLDGDRRRMHALSGKSEREMSVF